MDKISSISGERRRGTVKRSIFALPAAIAIAALFASCSTSKVTFFFKDASYQKQPRKVLVLAVVRKPVVRRVVEDEFVRRFRDRGIEALRGYTVFPGDELATKEALERELMAGGFDALLLMRLMDPRSDLPGAPGAATGQQGSPAGPGSGGWPAYYSACYAAVYSPNYTLEDKYALAETSLYDVATEKLIWTAVSETWLGGQNAQIMIWDYIDVMMGSLQKYKLVPEGK